MAKNPLPDQDLLNQLLRYEPETGRLFWRERPVELFEARGRMSREGGAKCWNKTYAGTEAFTASNDRGYRRGILLRGYYMAHRIIYKMVYGVDPDCVDHINRVRDDNRLSNLRSITHKENCAHFTGPAKKAA